MLQFREISESSFTTGIHHCAFPTWGYSPCLPGWFAIAESISVCENDSLLRGNIPAAILDSVKAKI